jgi:hypothetical protein
MNLRSLSARVATVSVLALLALLAACQTTTVRSAWFDTGFTGPPLRKVVVLGQINSTAEDRVFEDVFVAQLRSAGVDAIAGHSLGFDDARLSDAAFKSAVLGTGAQGLLLVRLLGVDTRTQVATTMVHGGMGWGNETWGTAMRPTTIPMQPVRQYDLATVETKLFEVTTKRLLWAATTATFNPTTVARETPGFARLIIGELADRNLIASP